MTTAIRYGTDPNGRPIYMTKFMKRWWIDVTFRLGFEPTIIQGAFMSRVGGGASASAGTHDHGGCLDLRVWDLTSEQVTRLLRELRHSGAAAWLRDERHGMDPHIHLVLGSDKALSSGAAYQWRQYLAGRDGLARNGADYHWRPDPIVTKAPAPLPVVKLARARRLAAWAGWARVFPKHAETEKLIKRALAAEGVKTYRDWQKKIGYRGADATGEPGVTSLTRLGKRHGFRVVA